MTGSGKTTSLWLEHAELPSRQPLGQDVEADVCVVGAGFAGLSCAYLLAKEGKKVVVLDDGPIAEGESCRTTAHLSSAIDDRYYHLERVHGARGAQLAAASHCAAIDQIEQIVQDEGIACDFTRLEGYLFPRTGDSEEILSRELDAAWRAGLTDVELIESPFEWMDGQVALRFGRQGQLSPLAYLAGLAQALESRGGRIFTHTHVQDVQGGNVAHVSTRLGPGVRAAGVVVATNTPVNDRVAIHIKQAPYRTYVLGFELPHGQLTRALYWDTGDPYHYLRLSQLPGQDVDVLIVGGEDHKTGQSADCRGCWRRLESWTRERLPMLSEAKYRWSGQVIETMDGLGFIGRNPNDEPNVYIATGDSGMGTTHGTIAGMLIRDLILGRPSEWADLYDPSRKPLGASGEFIRENLNVAARYTDWVRGGQVESLDEIKPGTGALLRRGLRKMAVYRDEAGRFHEFSASCVHMGCVVNWNECEKTWDCPCHGSRYDAFGRVINGPANRNLSPAQAQEPKRLRAS